MKQLYKTFDGLLNIKETIKCPLYNESFANFFIDKINKMYNEISLNSDKNLRYIYMDKLKKNNLHLRSHTNYNLNIY